MSWLSGNGADVVHVPHDVRLVLVLFLVLHHGTDSEVRRLLSVVLTRLILLSVGVNHRSPGFLSGIAISLEVAPLFAVSALHVLHVDVAFVGSLTLALSERVDSGDLVFFQVLRRTDGMRLRHKLSIFADRSKM